MGYEIVFKNFQNNLCEFFKYYLNIILYKCAYYNVKDLRFLVSNTEIDFWDLVGRSSLVFYFMDNYSGELYY